MSDRLAVGTKIKTIMNKEVVIEQWLAEGGQGDVYIVEYNNEKKALKWYKPNGIGKDRQAFYNNLKDNVIIGSPSPIFLWPLDVTKWDEKNSAFGYIMDLRPEGYYEVSDFMLTSVRFPSYRIVVDAALEIVSAYRILHNKGYSYQDLNDGNFFINPENGKVLICDNDNVAPDKTQMGIMGKPRYMAPEVVTHEEMPNYLSDLFSMSVILFILFFLNHPLEGKRSLTPSLTPKLQEKLYGTEPLFIMDEKNSDNGPDINIHRNVLMIWPLLPDYMRELFLSAFCQEALKLPGKRPREIDWIKNLVRFRSDIVQCECGNEVFVQKGKVCKCEICEKVIRIPYKLKLQNYSIPGINGNIVYRCQIGACNAAEALMPIGQIVSKKTDASMLGLKNLSNHSWDVITPSGNKKRVPPEGGIPFKNGLRFSIRGLDSVRFIEIIGKEK